MMTSMHAVQPLQVARPVRSRRLEAHAARRRLADDLAGSGTSCASAATPVKRQRQPAAKHAGLEQSDLHRAVPLRVARGGGASAAQGRTLPRSAVAVAATIQPYLPQAKIRFRRLRQSGRICARIMTASARQAPCMTVTHAFRPFDTHLDQRRRAGACCATPPHGADDGELFLERRRSEVLVFDDGRLQHGQLRRLRGIRPARGARRDGGLRPFHRDHRGRAAARRGDRAAGGRRRRRHAGRARPRATNRRLYSDADPMPDATFRGQGRDRCARSTPLPATSTRAWCRSRPRWPARHAGGGDPAPRRRLGRATPAR